MVKSDDVAGGRFEAKLTPLKLRINIAGTRLIIYRKREEFYKCFK